MFMARWALPIIASLVALVSMVSGLWLNARESVVEARQEVRVLQGDLDTALASEKRLRALLEAEQEALAERARQQELNAEQLAEARRSLSRIRAQAREEGSDASLACAVRPVPGAVDQLLRDVPPDAD